MRTILALFIAMSLPPAGSRAQAPAAQQAAMPKEKSIVTAQGPQLHIEYPEIRLSDKRVFIRARVESFDGISFCIMHESGIEAAISWEVMPNDWKAAFPHDSAQKVRLVESALANERKSKTFVPGSLKPTKPFVHDSLQPNAEQLAKTRAWEIKGAIDNAIAGHRVMIGMTQEQCLEAWGKPSHINKNINAFGVSEQWVYSMSNSYLYFEDGVLQSIQN